MGEAGTEWLGDLLQLRPMIEFRVVGQPVPQGSKVARIIGKRVHANGQRAIVGARVVLIEQADMATKTRKAHSLRNWRDRVARAASQALRASQWGGAVTNPLAMICEFVLVRPISHFNSRGALKSAALRDRPYPGKPDLSHLVRAIEDACTGILYADDKQIVRYSKITKRWATQGSGGAIVRFEIV